jgi:hypothetical protein
MARKPRPTPTAPDGEPKVPPADPDASPKSTVSEVQDPLISGDAGKKEGDRNADEAAVDEAGQIRKKNGPVDLLH